MYNETTSPSPPPQHSPWSSIPTGWTTIVSPDDGRIYYLETDTGRTSWVHPHAMEPPAAGFSSSLDPPGTNQNLPVSRTPPPSHSHPPMVEYPTRSTSSPSSNKFWTGGFGKFVKESVRDNSYTNSPQRPMMAAQAQAPPPITRVQYLDTPWNSTRRPNNYQCYAVCALILCFPLGICALYQSIMVDRSWDEGRYGDSVKHARQANLYSCVGTGIGVCFWVYWFFFAPGHRMRFFDGFHFDLFD